MSKRNQKFNYDTFASRVAEQAAKVLPYFDQGSEEQAQAAALFKSLAETVAQAKEASSQPMLERHLVKEAIYDVGRIEDCLRDLGAPTDLEVAFGREMNRLWYRYFDLAEQHPTLEDKEFRLLKANPAAEGAPKEWREEVLKKIQAEAENPTIRRRH